MAKYIIGAAVLAVLIFGLSFFIFLERVPPGYVGVVVDMTGGSSVSEEGSDLASVQVVSAGRHFIGPMEELYEFPTFVQNYVWTSSETEGSTKNEEFIFQDKDGLKFTGDFGVTYQVEPKNVEKLFLKYRQPLTEITDVYMRNVIRNEINRVSSQMSADSIMGSGKNGLMDTITKKVSESLEPEGILVRKVYIVGRIRPPQRVEKAINQKTEATQRAIQRENELRETKATSQIEKAKAEAKAEAKLIDARARSESILIEARAQAEANLLKQRSLTPLLIQEEYIKKWDGKLPTYNMGGNSNLMMTMPLK